MKTAARRFRDYMRLMYPFWGLVAAVWLLRWIMDAAGTPAQITRLVSVTVASGISILLAVLLIHWRQFGGYASVITASLLINIWTEGLISVALLFTILTGKTNIYSSPEYSGLLNQIEHLRAHLTFGIVTGTIVDGAVGCLFLWLLRTLVGSRKVRAVLEEKKPL